MEYLKPIIKLKILRKKSSNINVRGDLSSPKVAPFY